MPAVKHPIVWHPFAPSNDLISAKGDNRPTATLKQRTREGPILTNEHGRCQISAKREVNTCSLGLLITGDDLLRPFDIAGQDDPFLLRVKLIVGLAVDGHSLDRLLFRMAETHINPFRPIPR